MQSQLFSDSLFNINIGKIGTSDVKGKLTSVVTVFSDQLSFANYL